MEGNNTVNVLEFQWTQWISSSFDRFVNINKYYLIVCKVNLSNDTGWKLNGKFSARGVGQFAEVLLSVAPTYVGHGAGMCHLRSIGHLPTPRDCPHLANPSGRLDSRHHASSGTRVVDPECSLRDCLCFNVRASIRFSTPAFRMRRLWESVLNSSSRQEGRTFK